MLLFNKARVVKPSVFGSFRLLVHRGQSTVSKQRDSLRLSQAVASSGLCSRRQAEKWIRERRITVNGAIVTSPTYLVGAEEKVAIDGQAASAHSVPSPFLDEATLVPRLWMANKRRGELVAEFDNKKQRPLLLPRLNHLLESTSRGDKHQSTAGGMKPVIRLDFNVEGLCLLSNSGSLARLLGGAKSGLLKHYRIRLNGLVTESKLQGLARGLTISGKRYPAMNATIEKTSATISWIKLVTTETCCRDVKICLEQMHFNVVRMILVGFGPYKLNTLPPGGVDELTLLPEILSIYRARR